MSVHRTAQRKKHVLHNLGSQKRTHLPGYQPFGRSFEHLPKVTLSKLFPLTQLGTLKFPLPLPSRNIQDGAFGRGSRRWCLLARTTQGVNFSSIGARLALIKSMHGIAIAAQEATQTGRQPNAILITFLPQ